MARQLPYHFGLLLMMCGALASCADSPPGKTSAILCDEVFEEIGVWPTGHQDESCESHEWTGESLTADFVMPSAEFEAWANEVLPESDFWTDCGEGDIERCATGTRELESGADATVSIEVVTLPGSGKLGVVMSVSRE